MKEEVKEFLQKGFDTETNTLTKFLEEFTEEEIEAIYNIAKYHRDSIMEESPDKPNHDGMVDLITWVWESKMGRVSLFRNFSVYKQRGRKDICLTKQFYRRKTFLNFVHANVSRI